MKSIVEHKSKPIPVAMVYQSQLAVTELPTLKKKHGETKKGHKKGSKSGVQDDVYVKVKLLNDRSIEIFKAEQQE
jgi:hypothetical protein